MYNTVQFSTRQTTLQSRWCDFYETDRIALALYTIVYGETFVSGKPRFNHRPRVWWLAVIRIA